MMLTTAGIKATEEAIKVAKGIYATIRASRDALNQDESRGGFVPDEIERRREAEAERVRQIVERQLTSAQASTEAARQRVEDGLRRSKAVGADTLSSAQSSLAPFISDPRENPEDLLVLFERLFA